MVLLRRSLGAHPGLFFHHCGGAAAERQERRHFGCIWRAGKPDGIWPAWRGQRIVEGHDLVGGGVHGYVDHALGLRFETWRADFRIGGDQVAAGEDATCSDADTCESSGAEVVSGLRADCSGWREAADFAGDPWLRLKSGSAQDDAPTFKLQHDTQLSAELHRVIVRIRRS